MAEPMSILNPRPEPSLLEEIALLKAIDPAFVEKDWWVVQIIRRVAALQHEDFELIFSGGTCLAKAHRLLQRFSEDVDFRLLVPESSPHRSSRAALKRALSAYKNAVVESLCAEDFPIAEQHVKARNENRFISIEVEYESAFPQSASLRPHVLLEITAQNPQLPHHYLPVSSFVSELTNQVPEVAQIGCIDPVESAADKLSALAWRMLDRVRDGEHDDPSLVRHLHDLAILQEKALAYAEFGTLVEAAGQDETRAKNVSLAGLPLTEKLRQMLEKLTTDPAYPQEYELFVKGVSYAAAGSTPDFATALQSVQALVAAIAARRAA